MGARAWLACLALLGAVGCVRSAAPDHDARAVVERFLAARQARNLDATMDCFADEPGVRSSLGVSWAGRDAVRAIMAYRLTDTYTVGELRVDGSDVRWSEQVRRSVAGSPTAKFDEEVQAVVVGGHIVSLVTSVGGSHSSAAVEPPVQLSASTGLLVPLSILLLVAAIMVWPPTEPLYTRRTPTGRLLSGLRDYVARRG